MPVIQAEIEIAAPPEVVFDVAQSYMLRRKWDPFLRELELRQGDGTRRGDRVWVRAWTGLTMEVEYVNVDRPHAVAMRMVHGPWFFELFAGSWLFHATPAQGTRVVFRYNFRSRFGAARVLVDAVIERIFRRDLRARLTGLKHGIEVDGLSCRPRPARRSTARR